MRRYSELRLNWYSVERCIRRGRQAMSRLPLAKIEQLFKLMDVDADGNITENEAKTVGKAFGFQGDVFWKALKKFDANNDNLIQLNEFNQARSTESSASARSPRADVCARCH